MITSLHLRNFKGHRDTTIPLGRLTVLVGPNGAGKTSVLQGLRSLADLVRAIPSPWVLNVRPEDIVHRANPKGPIELSAEGSIHEIKWKASVELGWQEAQRGPPARKQGWDHALAWSYGESSERDDQQERPFQLFAPQDLCSALSATVLYQFDARKIAEPSFNPEELPSVGEDGKDTAAVLAFLKLEREEDFARIEQELHRIVPNVERIRLSRVTQNSRLGHKIHLDLRGAHNIPAQGASEGTLITLALLTVICGPSRPRLLLLDDLDRSLHPAAQIEQVREIKRLLGEMPDLQIVATTHSAHIVDELEPEDVVVFALRDDGSVAAKRLSEHPQAAKMKGMLSAGQLWTLDPEKDWVIEEKSP